jgi:hypothetical protein
MKLRQLPRVELNLHMEINEAEATALHELSRFNKDEVLKVLETLSPAYVKDHGPALKSLLNDASGCIHPYLNKLKDAREAFNKGTE